MKHVDHDPPPPTPSFTQHSTSSTDWEGKFFHSEGISVSTGAHPMCANKLNFMIAKFRTTSPASVA